MSATDFLQSVVTPLVQNPEEVSIEETHDDLGTLLTLKVDSSDMGVIIGKGGKTIEAIRTVLRVFGSKTEARVNIRLVEDEA